VTNKIEYKKTQNAKAILGGNGVKTQSKEEHNVRKKSQKKNKGKGNSSRQTAGGYHWEDHLL